LIWTTKLAAWLHDPAEKALILLRADHEEDSSIARLRELLMPGGVPGAVENAVRLADHWASAADRPTLPKPGDSGMREAFNIRFWGRDGAVLKHPLDGTAYHLPDMYTATAGKIEKASFAGLVALVEGTEKIDERKAFLRLWRLGPESDPPDLRLGALWRMLPADTRIPDHSIWEHLSLTSAFAGAMAGDPEGNPALLAVSLGPVQSFISQARSTSDLWAGSHLLAAMSWEAMKVICEELGPDAVIFPNLWGVPLVDVWLEKEGVEFPARGDAAPTWKKSVSDANPLFMAALPNRFVALVPASRAEELALAIEERVRSWVRETAHQAVEKLLEVAGAATGADVALREQIGHQLLGFPEVHWAAAPFAPLVEWEQEAARKGVKTTIRSVDGLRQSLAAFHPEGGGGPGFLGSEQWELLQWAIEGEGITYVPNPGVLYPALYDLLDRVMAAAKAARPFIQLREEGYRCTLCGEYEWLRGPGDEGAHESPPGQWKGTLWAAVTERRPAWARKGEHLCARCTLKRLWPDLFAERAASEVSELEREKLSRYVVSTHTMALARDLEELGTAGADLGDLREEVRRYSEGQRACLPRKLVRRLSGIPDVWPLVAEIPVALDRVREIDDKEERKASSRLSKVVENTLRHRPEAYYAMILFDGDRMGAWISGTDPDLTLPFEASWHPNVVRELGEAARGDAGLAGYLHMPRPPSPARHAAISSALNAFSLHVAPWVIEDLFAGKVLYAGGDDVLAMLPVDDVLPALLTLRAAYSGEVPKAEAALWELFGKLKDQLTLIGGGHVRLGGVNGRLLRMMGHSATASAGVVIAHHQTPLQGVLRELRGAERRAKDEGGRNAFSISLMKRAGGTTRFTAGFGFGGKAWEPASAVSTPLGALFALRDTLATEGVSRRAAYNILAWLPDLPERPGPGDDCLDGRSYAEMLQRSMAWQLSRQGVGWNMNGQPWSGMLADRLVQAAGVQAATAGGGLSHTGFLQGLITVAEFLAREGRAVATRHWESRDGSNSNDGAARSAKGGAA